MKQNIVKVFGFVKSLDGKTTREFDGEIVKLNEDNTFSLDDISYRPHLKQVESVSLLYPNEIWVREPDFDELNQDEVVVIKKDISNCYARQGSHWIRYIIDPRSLTIVGEENEEDAELKALEFSDIIVSKERLLQVLNSVGITDKKLADEILMLL